MRPLARPEKPYSITEILDKVERHFCVEKNPKSATKDGGCFYGYTGCAVGCLLTQQDADDLDANIRLGGLSGFINLNLFDLNPWLYKYFSTSEIGLLKELQEAHDYTQSDDISIAMQKIINEIRKELDISNEKL